MESEKVTAEEVLMAIVRRVVKDMLSECSPDYDVNVHKEILLAFAESARVFIHYLSATANDLWKESRRQTMKANDFSEFLEPIEGESNLITDHVVCACSDDVLFAHVSEVNVGKDQSPFHNTSS